MATFIMLSTLGPEGAATLRGDPERLLAVNREVEAMGVKVLHQWAVIGPYDFCNILEAPDEKAVALVALALAARGTMKTLTLTAIPVEDFIASVKHPGPV